MTDGFIYVGKAFDFFFNKMLPKKLIVFSIASIALFMGLITGTEWTIIAGIYLGLNLTGKAIQLIPHKKEKIQ